MFRLQTLKHGRVMAFCPPKQLVTLRAFVCSVLGSDHSMVNSIDEAISRSHEWSWQFLANHKVLIADFIAVTEQMTADAEPLKRYYRSLEV